MKVCGHKNPDLDSLTSAAVLAEFFTLEGKEAEPARASENVSEVAEWVFTKFGSPLPQHLPSAAGEQIFLVDHNSLAQSPDGISDAEIVGILDHHASTGDLDDHENLTIETVGATAALVAKKFFESEHEISPNSAGLLLAAILDDTVIFRSPTTTDSDREIAEQLAAIAGIENVEGFGKEIFQKKSNWYRMPTEKMLDCDAKVWEFGTKKVFCAVMETVDARGLLDRIDDIFDALHNKKSDENFDLAIVGISDILAEKSWVLADSDDLETLQKILPDAREEDGVLSLDGVLSRKKQIQAPLGEILS